MNTRPMVLAATLAALMAGSHFSLSTSSPLSPAAASAAELQVVLPLSRTAYQTNEWIDVGVVHAAKGPITLALAGEDGSQLGFQFADRHEGDAAAAKWTEHYHLNAWLLRPGHYKLTAAQGSDTSPALELDVVSHVRQSDFKVINWGRARGKEQLAQGENGMGYNLAYAAYSRDNTDGFLRAGMDFMSNCTMSGGHQMDLRMECDWSDPYVVRGGTQRVTQRALLDRTKGNATGVHFYDEPGLTWHKDATGELTPHGIPSQVVAYRRAFGHDPIAADKVDPNNPASVAQWRHWALWKLSFMDAAWKDSQFGVSRVRSDFLSLTQSQYGWSAPTDGYYFNVARSLPITSGHGGYDDVGAGYFYPGFVTEMARARDRWKPCWYLPIWYSSTPTDRFRLEQYLSFQTNIQGLMTPPDCDPIQPDKSISAQGIVESNHLVGRLGPIFNTMPVTKPQVAVLYSLSDMIKRQTADRKVNYFHETPQFMGILLCYLAGKLTQYPMQPLVEEDVLDGTLGEHKVLLLPSVDYLDPQVAAAIERYIADGGVAITTSDAKIQLKGLTRIDVAPHMPDQKIIDELMSKKAYDKLGPYTTTGKHLAAARPVAAALKPALLKAGVQPVLESDLPTLSATRQAAGDVEYLFAVNATYNEATGGRNDIQSAEANIGLADDGRPIYDAVLGGAAPFAKAGGKMSAKFRFGPGQMRVFARTARPIGSVQVSTPNVVSELVVEEQPLRVEFGASLADAAGRLLAGSVPLSIRLVDPLGATRHDLVRATRMGVYNKAPLPLAANDPPGEWTLEVRELLNNSVSTAKFEFAPPARPASLAGEIPRAVYFGEDIEHIFRLARTNHRLTIVKGTSAFNDAAAKRVTESLAPWGVACETMDLAVASKARSLTEEEARTWVGLQFTGSGQIKPGDGNPPAVAGFNVAGPVILLGNPEDHVMIKFLLEQKFLPYVPANGVFPGASRGYLAWQRDGIGKGLESIALIAYDEAGMAEAVGSLYEAVAGLAPLTRLKLPVVTAATPATSAPHKTAEAKIVWTAVLPDRVEAIKADASVITALSHDGSQATIDAGTGKLTLGKVLADAELEQAAKTSAPPNAAALQAAAKQVRPDRLMKLAATGGKGMAVAYWGGTLRIVRPDGTLATEQQLPQDVTALAWQQGHVLAGLADGRVLALSSE